MSVHSYRAAWLARFSPSIPGQTMSARDIAVLMAIVGRITDIPADPLEPSQRDNAVTLDLVANKSDWIRQQFSLARMRQALGLRNTRDLCASIDRLKHVHIDGKRAFSQLFYELPHGDHPGGIGVEFGPGRTVVAAHPLFDIEAQTRKGIAQFDTRRLGKVACVHSIPIATRAVAWHRCEYDHGLSQIIKRKRVEGHVLVTIGVDDINRALGLSESLRVRELRSLQGRIDTDMALFGLKLFWRWNGSGRKPTELVLTIGDLERATEVEPDDMSIAPDSNNFREVEIPVVAPVSNVVPFPTAPEPDDDIQEIDLEPQPEPFAYPEETEAPFDPHGWPLLDARSRPYMSYWLSSGEWPADLVTSHRTAAYHDLPRVEGDVAYDVPRGDNGQRMLPYRMESRFIRPTTITSVDDIMAFGEATMRAERARREAEAADYRAERGIDEDLAGDEYREDLDGDDDIDLDYDPDAVEA